MNKDFFSKQASFYAMYRPSYPKELFEFAFSLLSETNLAWDVATGNGQCAVSLSENFKNVFATDISENQLSHAIQKPNIKYKLEQAERSSLANESVDLITVATAIHWFDKPRFFLEVNRVLKPKGILFVWSYGGCSINPEIDEIVDHFNFKYLYEYWHEGAKENWVDKYQSLELPYAEIEAPSFIAKANYTLEELLNYFYSWSGVQAYIKKNNRNPIDYVKPKLERIWGGETFKEKLNGFCIINVVESHNSWFNFFQANNF